MQQTRKGTAHWTGVDGPLTMDARLLPELRFKLGNFPVAMLEALALLTTTVPASDRYVGALARML
jgi:hypothetical protein